MFILNHKTFCVKFTLRRRFLSKTPQFTVFSAFFLASHANVDYCSPTCLCLHTVMLLPLRIAFTLSEITLRLSVVVVYLSEKIFFSRKFTVIHGNSRPQKPSACGHTSVSIRVFRVTIIVFVFVIVFVIPPSVENK